MSDAGYTADDAARATTALRAAQGKGLEAFPAPVCVGMISDEVEALRAAGRSDADIVALLADAGVALSPDDLARFYAPPEARRRG